MTVGVRCFRSGKGGALHGGRSGFSLIELLAVIAIAGILSFLAIQAFNNIQSGYVLTQSANQMLDLLTTARQEAIARNRLVEVRFCREDTDSPFTQMVLVSSDGNGARGLITRPLRVPENVRIAEAAALSSLLDARPEFQGGGNGDVRIPGFPSGYRFRSFRFRPDGTTDLPWDPTENPRYFFSLVPSNQNSAAPENFALIQIDPLNGSTRLLRP